MQELPKLTGTEKQIVWAEEIRARIMPCAEDEMRRYVEEVVPRRMERSGVEATNQMTARMELAMDELRSEETADWWINHHRDTPTDPLHHARVPSGRASQFRAPASLLAKTARFGSFRSEALRRLHEMQEDDER